MAIVQSIAVGKARGSAGNVTFSTVKGRVIMKEKPIFVANPRTEAQQAQRNALARTVKLWQKIGFLAKDGWTRLNAYASPYNQFLSNNIPLVKELPGTVDDILEQDLKGLQISSGKLVSPLLNKSGMTVTDSSLTFDVDYGDSDLKIGDKVCVIAFDKLKGNAVKTELILDVNHYNDGVYQFTIFLPPPIEQSNILIGTYAVSADGKLSSSSYFE